MGKVTSKSTIAALKIPRLGSGVQGEDDCISSLSDGIIGEILSRLPIKDAVRTSVLSKTWEFNWTFLYSVNVNAKEFFSNPRSDKEMFFKFMDTIFVRLLNVRSVILRIECPAEFGMSRFAKWISVVSTHNLEILQLRVCYEKNTVSTYEYPIVPHDLLNHVSLKILEVIMPCTFKVGVSNYCANLTTLQLDGVKILNENTNTDTLRFTLPVLKILKLRECKWLKVKFVEINVPSLTSFICASNLNESHDYSIKIIGAKLEEFVMNGCHPENIIFSNSTVSIAYLICYFAGRSMSFDEYGLQIRKLLRQLSHSEHLILSCVLTAIGQTKAGGVILPMFQKLEFLSMNSPFDIEGFLEVLHATPNLKYLNLSMRDSDTFDYEDASFESVPACFVSHLEKVNLDYIGCDYPDSFDMAKFVLKNGVKIKKVYVRGCANRPTDEIIKELLTFPKGSTSLTIEGFS